MSLKKGGSSVPLTALASREAVDAARSSLEPSRSSIAPDRDERVDANLRHHRIHHLGLGDNPLEHRKTVAEVAH